MSIQPLGMQAIQVSLSGLATSENLDALVANFRQRLYEIFQR